MRYKTFYGTQLKPLQERSELCQEGLSAQGKLWPVGEPRCNLTSVRHQSIRVSVTVTLFRPLNMMSILFVELAKCGSVWKECETSVDHQSRSNLVALNFSDRDDVNVDSSRLSFQVAHVRSGLYVGLLLAAQEDEQSSCVLE